MVLEAKKKKKSTRNISDCIYTLIIRCIFKSFDGYLAEGTRKPLDKSGGSISRKLVSNVFREDCAFEPLGDIFWFPSVPFSIFIASCMANIISCILGLQTPCCSTHWIATSATLHIDSIFTFPVRNGSIMLTTSPFRIKDLACKTAGLVLLKTQICNYFNYYTKRLKKTAIRSTLSMQIKGLFSFMSFLSPILD